MALKAALEAAVALKAAVKVAVVGSLVYGYGWLWSTIDLCSRYNVCLEGGALVQATPRTTST